MRAKVSARLHSDKNGCQAFVCFIQYWRQSDNKIVQIEVSNISLSNVPALLLLSDYLNVFSLRLAIEGIIVATRNISASIKRVKLNGRVKKTVGEPREIVMARRRYSSIIGPRIKPKSMGAGSK